MSRPRSLRLPGRTGPSSPRPSSYRGKIISVRTDTSPDARRATTAEREVVEHPGAVGVVALDDR